MVVSHPNIKLFVRGFEIQWIKDVIPASSSLAIQNLNERLIFAGAVQSSEDSGDDGPGLGFVLVDDFEIPAFEEVPGDPIAVIGSRVADAV